MAREDNFRQAVKLSRQELSDLDPGLLAEFSGGFVSREGFALRLNLPFLGRPIRITWPELGVARADTSEYLPMEQQVLVLHYLEGAWRSKGRALTGEWTAFQDLPEGRFYHEPFRRRAMLPLLKAFGREPERLLELAYKAYNSESIALGDVSVSVSALPMIRVALVVWAGDDEFPAEGNILFDKNTASYFSADDMAWLCGMIVYPLVGMAAWERKG